MLYFATVYCSILLYYIYYAMYGTHSLIHCSCMIGCSYAVLLIIADFVIGKRLPSIFTFDKDILTGWIEEAKVSLYVCMSVC